MLFPDFTNKIQQNAAVLSGVCRHIHEEGLGVAEINEKNIDFYRKSEYIPADLLSKIERMLIFIGKNSSDTFTRFIVGKNIFPSVAFLKDDKELYEMLELLISDGTLERVNRTLDEPRTYKLTMKGVRDIRAIRPKNRESKQAFIAMWFDPSLDVAHKDAFSAAIKQCGYEPKRIDKVFFNNNVCDEIIASIRSSRFIIADFTGNRGGVYFEAGFAMGLGIPVIYTCHKDWFNCKSFGEIAVKAKNGKTVTGIVEHEERVHFDVDHYQFILWETVDDLKEKLIAKISATIGEINVY